MKRIGQVGSYAFALWLALAGAGLAEGGAGVGGLSGEVATADSALTSGPCDSDFCCSDHRRESFWFAGTDMTFLKLDASTGGQATITLDDSDTAGVDLAIVGAGGAKDDTGYAPRMWLGRQLNEKWGVVGRGWYLNDSSDKPPAPAPGAVNGPHFLTLSDTSRTQLYTVDFEGVRSFELGRWKFDGSVGARHASFHVDSTISASGVFTTGNFLQLSLGTMSSFEGTGVTYSLVGRRQISDSPVYLFVSGRGSNLDGTASGRARVAGTVASSPSAPLVGAAAVTRSNYDATASIAELQLGMQCEFALALLPVNAFFRAAFEYQFWDIHSLPVGGAGFGGTINDVQTSSFASLQGHGDASLRGFVFGTGFTW